MNKTKSIAILLLILSGLIVIMFPGILYYFFVLKLYGDFITYLIFYLIAVVAFIYAKNLL